MTQDASEKPAPEPVAGERRGGERRQAERRQGLRRAEDRQRSRFYTLRAGFWAVLAGLVVLYLFLLAIGGINPDNAKAVSVGVLVIAVVWVVHAWRRLWAGGFSSRPDRERRGF
jgi:hypothetical protein